MAGVLSVERLTITLAAGTASASANLTKSQTLANCAVFMSKRNTTTASPADNWAQQCVDVELQSGPDRVTATTNNGATRALVVECTVVEFDPARVTVQQGTFTIAAAASSGTATITAVTLANSFVVAHWESAASDNINDSSAVRARFTSTTQLTFDRGATSGAINGHYFVVESDSADFSVEEVTITLSAVASNTGTITSVTMAKTFLTGSYTASGTADDNTLGSIEVVLTNATTITVQRNGTGGTIVWTGHAIEFAGGGDENVQRGQIAAQGATASQNVTVTSVDLTEAMVNNAGHNGASFKHNSFPGGGSSDNSDSQCGWDFVDATTIRVQHSTGGGEASNDLSWEVVEWEIVLAISVTPTPVVLTLAVPVPLVGFPLSGVTRDLITKAALGNQQCYLFRHDAADPRAFTHQASAESDGSGNYQFIVSDGVSQYMVVVQEPGGTPEFGVTQDDLARD